VADLKEIAERRSALLHIDPRIIKVKPGLNARDMSDPETLAHVEWLAESIAECGVRHPLEVISEGPDVFVVHGHCRLAGALLAIERGAPLLTVPCVPEPKGTNEVDRILNQNVDNTGKPLTPLEAGQNIKRAQALGWTIPKIAAKLGRSVSYVTQALEFQAAPAEVHEAVKAGEISATLAAQTLKAEGVEAGAKVIREGIERARTEGRRKATAKTLGLSKGEPLRDAPKKSVQSGKSDAEVVVRQASLGQISVQFGERSPVVLPKSAWEEIMDKICDVMEGKKRVA
jgi:hypothetical protein